MKYCRQNIEDVSLNNLSNKLQRYGTVTTFHKLHMAHSQEPRMPWQGARVDSAGEAPSFKFRGFNTDERRLGNLSTRILDVQTEMGMLLLQPGEICVIPRGVARSWAFGWSWISESSGLSPSCGAYRRESPRGVGDNQQNKRLIQRHRTES